MGTSTNTWQGQILLVDDDPTLLELGSAVLRSGGFHVDVATDGQNALDLLQFCLKEHFAIRIYREESLSVHEEFAAVFDTYKEHKFKLSKHKKVLREAREDAVATITRHRRLRTYLRMELDTMLAFFSDHPRLLGPKFQMLMALLKDEEFLNLSAKFAGYDLSMSGQVVFRG